MQKVLPDDKDFLTPAEAVDYFWLSRRKFSEWIQKESSPVLIARYGKRILINREAFEEYLDKHPELRRRE